MIVYKNTETTPVITGMHIQRKPEATIVDDLADIVMAVRGSGLPVSFLSKDCSVNEQLLSVCKYLDITPAQATLLSVAVELSGHKITLRRMANYLGCVETRLHAMYWDFRKLEELNLLNKDEGSQPCEYHIPATAIAKWSANNIYQTKYGSSRKEVNYALVSRIADNIIKRKFIDEITVPASQVNDYLDVQLDYFKSATLLDDFEISYTGKCPCPSVGLRVLLLIAACETLMTRIKPSRDELFRLLYTEHKPSERTQFDSVLDYLIRKNALEPQEADSFRFSYSLYDVVTGEMGMQNHRGKEPTAVGE